MTIESIMNYLLENRAKNLPSIALAGVCDQLVWCLNDNGKTLLEIRDKWLNGDDYDKVGIALNMQETFPYHSQEEMIKNFERIKARWPSLSEQCEKILQEWDSQFNK